MAVPQFATIHAYVEYWAQVAPDREALVGGGQRLTYREMRDRSRDQAAGLLCLGVRPGDRVAVLAPPSPEFFVSFLAVVSLGAVYLGLNPKLTDAEIGYQLSDAQPRLVLHHPAAHYRQRAAQLSAAGREPAAVPPESLHALARSGYATLAAGVDAAAQAVTGADAAAIVYTSGTTGQPKGAVLPHQGFASTYAIQNRRWLSAEAERAPVVEPINHVAALGDESFALVAAGGTAVFLEQFDAEQLLRVIEEERITFWYTDPSILGLCVRSPRWAQTDFASLRRVVWSGGRAPLLLVRELRKLGVPLGTSWGMTETVGSAIYTDNDADDDVLASTLGRPDPAYEVTVVAEDATPVPQGEPGELWVRNQHVMIGYFNRPEATREAIDAAGWLHTGDVVRTRPDGNLELVGRVSDMFKSGGENVYPRDVEQVLESHPAVVAATVVSRPHELWGQVGHAYVVTCATVTVNDLRHHSRQHLARYKVPKTFEIVSELPILPSGKVDRRALTRRAVNGADHNEAEVTR